MSSGAPKSKSALAPSVFSGSIGGIFFKRKFGLLYNTNRYTSEHRTLKEFFYLTQALRWRLNCLWFYEKSAAFCGTVLIYASTAAMAESHSDLGLLRSTIWHSGTTSCTTCRVGGNGIRGDREYILIGMGHSEWVMGPSRYETAEHLAVQLCGPCYSISRHSPLLLLLRCCCNKVRCLLL